MLSGLVDIVEREYWKNNKWREIEQQTQLENFAIKKDKFKISIQVVSLFSCKCIQMV